MPEPAWPGQVPHAGFRALDVPWAQVTNGSAIADGPKSTNVAGLAKWLREHPTRRLLNGSAIADGPKSTDVAGLAKWLREHPTARLLIRGGASTGKSVFARQLMAELLQDREQEDPGAGIPAAVVVGPRTSKA